MTIIVIIVIFLYILVIIGTMLFFLWSISNFLNIGTVPFVPTKKKVLQHVLEAMNLDEHSVVYDIGSGNGKVLFALHERYPVAHYKGIEKNFFVYWMALSLWWYKGTPHTIKFIKKDIFVSDLSDATHIYGFLLPQFMDTLLPKLQRELKPGTMFVSLIFPFSDKQPREVRTFQPGILSQKESRLYIYEF